MSFDDDQTKNQQSVKWISHFLMYQVNVICEQNITVLNELDIKTIPNLGELDIETIFNLSELYLVAPRLN